MATWYVDNSVGTSGTGTSLAGAWKDFANIVWASIAPGDTLLVSGGASSQTYNTATLTIGASGSAGRSILITTTGGTVIIDGQNARICIDTNSQNYVVVDGFHLQNTNDTCIYVNTATAGVVVQNLTIFASGPNASGNARGIDIRHCAGAGCAIVRANTITTAGNSTDQTDAIYLQDNDGLVIDGNSCIVSNANTTGHNDCIQVYDCNNITIRNNYCEQSVGTTNNHGMWLSDTRTGSTYTVYNNVVNMPGSNQNPCITHWNEAGWTGNALIYNNTLYGTEICVNIDTTSTATQIMNNIMVAAPGVGQGYAITGVTLPTANVDYNLFFSPGGSLFIACVSGSGIGGVRSTTSFSTGKLYYEVTAGTQFNGSNSGFGVANATQSLTAFWGNSANSIGYFSNGQIWIGNANTVTIQTFAPGNVIAVAIDLTDHTIWYKNLTTASNWNNSGTANPATNAGGISISGITGAVFAGTSESETGDSLFFNFGATAFVGTLPSGFSAWGAAAVLNASDIAGPVTLGAPVAIAGGTTYSWSSWRTAGYDAHSVNADPLFVNQSVKNFHLSLGSPAINAGTSV